MRGDSKPLELPVVDSSTVMLSPLSSRSLQAREIALGDFIAAWPPKRHPIDIENVGGHGRAPSRLPFKKNVLDVEVMMPGATGGE